MKKDFDNWNKIKKLLDKRVRYPSFKEREIWWTNIGLNIGDEECGKGNRSVRPVLVIKKFNNNFFLALPLSSVQKENKYYFNFDFKGKKQAAMLCQIRSCSAKRLGNIYGKLNEEVFTLIMRRVSTLLNLSR